MHPSIFEVINGQKLSYCVVQPQKEILGITTEFETLVAGIGLLVIWKAYHRIPNKLGWNRPCCLLREREKKTLILIHVVSTYN